MLLNLLYPIIIVSHLTTIKNNSFNLFTELAGCYIIITLTKYYVVKKNLVTQIQLYYNTDVDNLVLKEILDGIKKVISIYKYTVKAIFKELNSISNETEFIIE